jgi:hypothetical protein
MQAGSPQRIAADTAGFKIGPFFSNGCRSALAEPVLPSFPLNARRDCRARAVNRATIMHVVRKIGGGTFAADCVNMIRV